MVVRFDLAVPAGEDDAFAPLAGERSPPLLPYAIRRVARIVPAYWGRADHHRPLAASVRYVHRRGHRHLIRVPSSLRSVTGGIGQAWTLTVEVSFYTLLPLLATGDRRLPGPVVRSELALVAALFAGGLPGRFSCSRREAPLAGR